MLFFKCWRLPELFFLLKWQLVLGLLEAFEACLNAHKLVHPCFSTHFGQSTRLSRANELESTMPPHIVDETFIYKESHVVMFRMILDR